jgi:MFS family permease
MEKNSIESNGLRPYQFGFVFSFFNSTSWMVALGTPVVLLAETLGASALQVGLLYSFVFLLLPIQVIATSTLPRFGYKKQVLMAWSVRTIFLFIPLYIVLYKPEEVNPVYVNWLLASMFLFSFFRSIGTSAIQPWLFDLLPEKLVARYFSVDTIFINMGGVIALVFCSLTFHWFSNFDAFSVQYLFAIAGAVFSVLGLSRLPGVANPPSFGPLRIFKAGPALLTKPGRFRRYLLLSLVWVVGGSAVVPFGIYYLKSEAGLPNTQIVLFTAIQSLGGIAGALIMRNRIDKFGIQRSFLIVIVLNVIIYLSWILYIIYGMHFPGQLELLHWALPITYLVTGASAAVYVTCHLKYLAYVTRKTERALKVSLQTAVVGFATGVASIGWGILFKKTGGAAGMNLPAFIGYFLVIILFQFLLVPTIRKLAEPDRGIKPITDSYGIMRPWRFLATMPVLRRQKGEMLEQSNTDE